MSDRDRAPGALAIVVAVVTGFLLAGCDVSALADRILLESGTPAPGTPLPILPNVTPTPLPTPTPRALAPRPVSIRVEKVSVKPGQEQKISISATPASMLNVMVVYANGVIATDATRLGAPVDSRGQFSESWPVDKYAPGGRVTVSARQIGTQQQDVAYFLIDAPEWANPAPVAAAPPPTVAPGPLTGVGTAIPPTAPLGFATPAPSQTVAADLALTPVAVPTVDLAAQSTAAPVDAALTFRAWADTLTIPAAGGSQTIRGQVLDSAGRPVAGGRMYAIGRLPQGQTEVWQTDQPTDAAGTTSVSFRVPPLARGSRVDVDVYMVIGAKSYTGTVALTVR